MDNSCFFDQDDIVVWNGIIMHYRFFAVFFSQDDGDVLRLASTNELTLFKKHG